MKDTVDGQTSGVTLEWAESHLATVFCRWDPQVTAFQNQSSARLIAEAGIASGMHVLDIASGSGVPSLQEAQIVGPQGTVVATEPNSMFLAKLRENIKDRHAPNVETAQCSASGLPFEVGSFDAATCHMGVMFFSDLDKSLASIRRVLRPGARAAFVAWGPDPDNSFTRTLGPIASRFLPPPPTDASPPPAPTLDQPRPTRFAEPGTLAAVLRDAGFVDVREESPVVEFTWPEAPDSMIRFWMELTGIGDLLPAGKRDPYIAEMHAALLPFSSANGLTFPVRIVVASGAAPA